MLPVSRCPQRPEETVGVPRAGVRGGCDLPVIQMLGTKLASLEEQQILIILSCLSVPTFNILVQIKPTMHQVVAIHAFNLNTLETETGRFL